MVTRANILAICNSHVSWICRIHYSTPFLLRLISVLFGFVPSGVDGLSIEITTAVDIRDQTNKELAMRLVTDIQSGDVFYTDLNGFQVCPTLQFWREQLQYEY